MALPIRSAWFVLVCFSVVSHGRPPIADPTGLLDQAVRGAARLGIALTAPVVNIARGITERIEPVIVRDPDVVAASRGVPYYLQYKGYPVEVHKITTEDNITVTAHRIPREGATPVLLQHGLLCCSFDFVNNLPSQSLGFILWDAGFDVWILNSRGNVYSSESAKERRKFYEFSWDELAVYDLPANIDYVLETTGKSSVHLIGHSQGTTITVAMLAAKPEYNKKIRLATLLSPVVFLDGLSHLARLMVDLYSNPLIGYLTDILTEDRPFLSQSDSDPVYFLTNPIVCSLAPCPITNDLSGRIIPTTGFYNRSRVAVYATHFPAGTSANDLKQYVQLYKKQSFAHFDFEDPQKNLRKYGTVPEYDLSNVRAKMIIFYSQEDAVVPVKAARRLVEQFKANIYKDTAVEIRDPNYNHMDFVWAVNNKPQIYDVIVQRMKEFDEENASDDEH